MPTYLIRAADPHPGLSNLILRDLVPFGAEDQRVNAYSHTLQYAINALVTNGTVNSRDAAVREIAREAARPMLALGVSYGRGGFHRNKTQAYRMYGDLLHSLRYTEAEVKAMLRQARAARPEVVPVYDQVVSLDAQSIGGSLGLMRVMGPTQSWHASPFVHKSVLKVHNI